MNQKSLSNVLKLITVSMGIVGLFVFFWIIPELIEEITEQASMLQSYWCWMFLAWIIAVPCYMSLFAFYRISHRIGEDLFFTLKTAQLLKYITSCLNATAGLILLGIVALQLAGVAGHAGLLLLLLFVVFVMFALSTVSSTLSYLVNRAVKMQEERELTV